MLSVQYYKQDHKGREVFTCINSESLLIRDPESEEFFYVEPFQSEPLRSVTYNVDIYMDEESICYDKDVLEAFAEKDALIRLQMNQLGAKGYRGIFNAEILANRAMEEAYLKVYKEMRE